MGDTQGHKLVNNNSKSSKGVTLYRLNHTPQPCLVQNKVKTSRLATSVSSGCQLYCWCRQLMGGAPHRAGWSVCFVLSLNHLHLLTLTHRTPSHLLEWFWDTAVKTHYMWSGPTQHEQICDALLVATRVGSIFADVLPLIGHPNIAYLDGGTVQIWGAGREADPALHGRVGVVGVKSGVKHSDIHPLSFLRLIDPRDLRWRKRGLGCLSWL